MSTTTTAVPPRSSELAGTRGLVRAALRLDRGRTTIWAVAVAGLTQVSVVALSRLYSTPESRAARAQLISSPAATALAGPGYGLDDYTVGAMTANELGLWIMIPVAIMALLTVTRHDPRGRTARARADRPPPPPAGAASRSEGP